MRKTIARAARLSVASALAAGLLAASLVTAQPAPSADRSQDVAGWRVEDVTDREEDDTVHRIVRMSRTIGGMEFSFALNVSWHPPEESRGLYTAHLGGAFCHYTTEAVVPNGAPADRAAATREQIAVELARLEQECPDEEAPAAHLLEGFEPAFGVFIAWYDVRRAETDAQIAAEEAAVAAEYGAIGPQEMNVVEAAADLLGSVDMNATEPQ